MASRQFALLCDGVFHRTEPLCTIIYAIPKALPLTLPPALLSRSPSPSRHHTPRYNMDQVESALVETFGTLYQFRCSSRSLRNFSIESNFVYSGAAYIGAMVALAFVVVSHSHFTMLT